MNKDASILITFLLMLILFFINLYVESNLIIVRITLIALVSFLYPLFICSIRYWKLLLVFVVLSIMSNFLGIYSIYVKYNYDNITLYVLLAFIMVLVLIQCTLFSLGFILKKIIDKRRKSKLNAVKR